MRILALIAAAPLLHGCIEADSRSADRFAANGTVIAHGGAGASAGNACFTCHGLDGLGNGAGSPRLAGLDGGYLERQLDAYADGRRQHRQMAWIARALEPGERKAVAFHYAAQPSSPSAAPLARRLRLYHAGDAARGLPGCAACHGDRGQGRGAANPPLAGQPAGYLAEQLRLWRVGQRRNDPGEVMLRISQLLTPSEAEALAVYAAGLPGGPASPEFPATSPSARRDDPRSGASGPPLHVPE